MHRQHWVIVYFELQECHFGQLTTLFLCWHSFWYVSDGYAVYPCFIEPEDHLAAFSSTARSAEGRRCAVA